MYYKLIRENIAGKAVRGMIYSVEHRFSRSAGIYKEYLTEIAPILENADCLIPALIYKVQVTMSPKFGKLMPVLVQVPGRTGIRIHRGTKPEHSKGCILIPDKEICERLTNTLLQEQNHKEPIYLEIYEDQQTDARSGSVQRTERSGNRQKDHECMVLESLRPRMGRKQPVIWGMPVKKGQLRLSLFLGKCYKMDKFCIFFKKNLVMSEKSCNFAGFFA